MMKRPIPVTIISLLYIATGIVGLAYHFSQFKVQHPFQFDIVWIGLVEFMAIASGAFMLRGKNWARWLAIAWIAFHVVISAFHPLQELVIHGVLFIAITYFLFRPLANEYFRAR